MPGNLAVSGHFFQLWWPGTESNHRHADFQSAALPTELPGHEERKYNKVDCVAQGLLLNFFLKRSSTSRRMHACHSPCASLLFLPRSTPSCFSFLYKCVRSSPVFSATRVMLPFSRAR